MKSLIIEPNIELAQIISTNYLVNCYNTSIMCIGMSNNSIYRILIKIPINNLPSNTEIIKAQLNITVSSVKPEFSKIITSYALMDPWTINTVEWDNQPSYNPCIHGKSVDVKKATKYDIDITPIIKLWYENEISNYGIVLKTNEQKCSSLVKILSATDRLNGPAVEIFYEPKCSFEIIPTKFTEKIEEFDVVSNILYSYSMLRNTSLTKTVIFYVQNLGMNKINAHLQSSPDGVNFIDEQTQITLDMNEIYFIVPCIFGRFTRVAVRNDSLIGNSRVKIWYLAQE